MELADDRTMRCIVQFMHPGSEVRPHPDGTCEWSSASCPHTRRFMVAQGQHLDAPTSNTRSGPIAFWGEWEAQSSVLRALDRDADREPRFLHEPFWAGGGAAQYPPLQNTDPFVFGGPFRYTGCKQWRRTGNGDTRAPTMLRDLADGSLILFGSKVERRFVLDTAFVVARSFLHTEADWRSKLSRIVPPTYRAVTLEPWYGLRQHGPFRLYEGATPAAAVDGMFSFTPCTPWNAGQRRGFARPAIDLDGVINQRLMMGQRFLRNADREQIADCWRAIAEQVTDQGLALGVGAEMPPERP